MNLYLLLVPIGGALLVLVVCAALAACGVDGFRGDKPRHRTVYVTTPMPQRASQGPLRVVAQRVDQVEAA